MVTPNPSYSFYNICSRCIGTGKIMLAVNPGDTPAQVSCPNCAGTGKILTGTMVQTPS